MVQPLLLLGLAVAFVGLVPWLAPVHGVLSRAADLLTGLLNGWAVWLSTKPGASIYFDTAYAALVCLLLCGLGVLAFRWRVRLRVALPGILLTAAVGIGLGLGLPLVQGVSFAGVATMVSILQTGGGLPGILGAVMASAVLGLLVAPVFSKVTRFFPPLVNGCVITVIGLSLIPVAAHWAMGGNARAADYGSMSNIALAGISLVIVLGLSKVGSAAISRLSILLAIVLGTVVAVFMGKADFSRVLEGAWFAIPTPMHFGMPTFNTAAILSMFIVILVILVETSADVLAVGDIVGTRVDSRRLGDGLRADMLSSIVAPVFGAFTQSAFAQNVGLVVVTGVKSRWVCVAGGVILIILGVLPKMAALVESLPTVVLGGAGLVMFGMVAATGIRILSKVDFQHNRNNAMIVAVSIGVGMIPLVAPNFRQWMPHSIHPLIESGILLSSLAAVALNVFFNGAKHDARAAIEAAKQAEAH